MFQNLYFKLAARRGFYCLDVEGQIVFTVEKEMLNLSFTICFDNGLDTVHKIASVVWRNKRFLLKKN